MILLCDDSEEMQKYVNQQLGNDWNADYIRGQLLAGKDDDWVKKYKGTHLFVDVFGGKSLRMPNLLGQLIQVEVANTDELTSLLLGDDIRHAKEKPFVKYYSCKYVDRPVAGKYDGCKSVYLYLRYLSAEERMKMGQDKIKSLLEETIRKLAEEMTGDKSAAASLLEDLKKTEQLALDSVRKMILDGLQDYLPSLGIRKSKLNFLLEKWHKFIMNQILAERNGNDDLIKEANNNIRDVKEKLQNCVENDEDVQNDILRAVIKRITEHCGYDFESIPFELFQNADDAVKERELFEKNMSRYRRIMVQLTNSALTVIHYGRPINKNLSNKIDDDDAYGNLYDLEKMLKLWRSDKEIGEIRRTGKFGLGFKSVYQLCDSPLISSASLRFSIKGTLFPLDATIAEKLLMAGLSQDIREKANIVGQMPPETLIHLPIRSGIEVKGYGEKETGAKDVMRLNKFVDSADLLVIFSRAIKEIVIIDKNRTFAFEYKQKTKISGVDIINTRPEKAFGIISLEKSRVSIAFGYDLKKECFVPLDEDIATIWITEPTKEYHNLGFAVNGDFAVDIGRNSLITANKQNEELAEDAGKELAKFLEEHCKEDTFTTVWLDSLWNCFVSKSSGTWALRNSSGLGNYLPKIIWGSKNQLRGYGKFISEYPAIPTKLNYTNESYLKLGACKYYLDKDFQDDEAIWHLFKPFVEGKLKNTVSQDIGEALKNILYVQLEQISGFSILKKWFEKHQFLQPEDVNAYNWQEIIDYCSKKELALLQF